mgnify:CR=1 FL=1
MLFSDKSAFSQTMVEKFCFKCRGRNLNLQTMNARVTELNLPHQTMIKKLYLFLSHSPTRTSAMRGKGGSHTIQDALLDLGFTDLQILKENLQVCKRPMFPEAILSTDIASEVFSVIFVRLLSYTLYGFIRRTQPGPWSAGVLLPKHSGNTRVSLVKIN